MARFGHDDARVREPDLDAAHPRTVADARFGENAGVPASRVNENAVRHAKIGRASCRERVFSSV